MTALPLRYDEIVRRLEETGDFRVLRRFRPPERYCDEERSPDIPPLRRACIVDVETTGLGDDARIIEFSILEFEFDLHTGQIYGVVNCYSGLEDPGIPIPPEITEITGITNEDVAGKTLDEEQIKAIATDAELVIAYKAEFDRPLCERRFPALFVDKHWACALEEVPWDDFGARGKKQLDYMLERILGLFCDGHRAMEDCEVTLHLLAVPRAFTQPPGQIPVHEWSPFQFLLHSVQTPRYRVFAINSPYDTKGFLKKRGYTWSDGSKGRRKAWYIDVAKEKVEAEIAFLGGEVYGPYHAHCQALAVKLSARDLYSIRV